jgi:hypothetical protein
VSGLPDAVPATGTKDELVTCAPVLLAMSVTTEPLYFVAAAIITFQLVTIALSIADWTAVSWAIVRPIAAVFH